MKKMKKTKNPLQASYDELLETVAPFILHGKALGAQDRTDITAVVSKAGSSYLCIGAFKGLMGLCLKKPSFE